VMAARAQSSVRAWETEGERPWPPGGGEAARLVVVALSQLHISLSLSPRARVLLPASPPPHHVPCPTLPSYSTSAAGAALPPARRPRALPASPTPVDCALPSLFSLSLTFHSPNLLLYRRDPPPADASAPRFYLPYTSSPPPSTRALTQPPVLPLLHSASLTFFRARAAPIPLRPDRQRARGFHRRRLIPSCRTTSSSVALYEQRVARARLAALSRGIHVRARPQRLDREVRPSSSSLSLPHPTPHTPHSCRAPAPRRRPAAHPIRLHFLPHPRLLAPALASSAPTRRPHQPAASRCAPGAVPSCRGLVPTVEKGAAATQTLLDPGLLLPGHGNPPAARGSC
jgi:hypothetical protein